MYNFGCQWDSAYLISDMDFPLVKHSWSVDESSGRILSNSIDQRDSIDTRARYFSLIVSMSPRWKIDSDDFLERKCYLFGKRSDEHKL
jgi:hypothetical protein